MTDREIYDRLVKLEISMGKLEVVTSRNERLLWVAMAALLVKTVHQLVALV